MGVAATTSLSHEPLQQQHGAMEQEHSSHAVPGVCLLHGLQTSASMDKMLWVSAAVLVQQPSGDMHWCKHSLKAGGSKHVLSLQPLECCHEHD